MTGSINLQITTDGKLIIWTYQEMDDACESWRNVGYWTTKEAALKAYLADGGAPEYAENVIHSLEVNS